MSVLSGFKQGCGFTLGCVVALVVILIILSLCSVITIN